MGRQLILKLPTHSPTVALLLLFSLDSIPDHQDILVTVVTTLTLLRASEVGELSPAICFTAVLSICDDKGTPDGPVAPSGNLRVLEGVQSGQRAKQLRHFVQPG